MKPLLIISLILIFPALRAQNKVEIAKKNIYRIAEINPDYGNFKDLKFLNSILKDKQIVWLAEHHHGDGSTKLFQGRIVKYLHKELGFDVIIFEYDFFVASYVAKLINSGIPARKAFKMIYIGNLSKSLLPMIDYIGSSQQSGTPISIAGIDISSLSIINDSLRDVIKHEISQTDSSIFNSKEWVILWSYLLREKNLLYEKDLVVDTENLIPVLEKYGLKFEQSNPYLSQLLKNEKANIEFVIKYHALKNKKHIDFMELSRERDIQMASNLQWLLTNTYKDKKVIVITSAYHMLRNVNKIETKDKKISSLRPMNEFVFPQYGDKMYCMAFGFGGGYMGMQGKRGKTYQELKAFKGSVEKYLKEAKYKYCFVEAKHLPDPCKLNVTFNKAQKAHWAELIDGFFYINEMQPDDRFFLFDDY